MSSFGRQGTDLFSRLVGGDQPEADHRGGVDTRREKGA